MNKSKNKINRRKFNRYWVIGICSFIFFLIATAPASLVRSFIGQDDAVILQGLKGTIWTGSASNLNYHGIDMGQLNWHISPLSLFLLRLQTQIYTENADSHINLALTLSPGSLSSDSLKAQIPANWLQKISTMPFKTDGDLLLRFVKLEMESGKLTQLKGSIAWQNAIVNSPFGAPSELGNLQITASTEAEDILLNITDTSGPLGIKSTIRFTPPDTIKADGTVNKNLPQNLANFFQYFAKPDKNGRLEFHYQGKVPGL